MSKECWGVFESINPVHAAALSWIDTKGSGLERVLTLAGEDNLLDSRGALSRYIHSQEGAFAEARQWVCDSLKNITEKTEILVVYGIGLGWQWRALLPWVERKKSRRLIFIEDDLEIIAHFFETAAGHACLLHDQTSLVAISMPKGQGSIDQESIDLISWNLFQKSYCFLTCLDYQKSRPDAAKAVQDALHVRATDIHLVAAEFASFGLQHARNLLRNVNILKNAKNGQELFQKFCGLPIIVVAAGPSLGEAIPYLRKWQEKAIILAGGSSANALLEAGIIPHAAVSVDPNPLQYSRMKYLEPFQIPLFFRSRALPEAVMAADGAPLLYLKGSDGYPLVSYFEDALGIEGDILDGGDSVSNLLIELAAAFGGSPIIMVGYDLGYPGKKRYADSMAAILHDSEDGVDVFSDALSEPLHATTSIANNGEWVRTESKWVVEKQWIEQFVLKAQHFLDPAPFVIYNAAASGLRIESVPHMPLPELDETVFGAQKPIPKEALAMSEDVSAQFTSAVYSCASLRESASNEAVFRSIQALSQSLSEIREVVQRMIDFCRESLHLYQNSLKNRELGKEEAPILASGANRESAEYVELSLALESSLAFQNILAPFWAMHEKWKAMTIRLETPYFRDDWRSVREQMESAALLERLEFILSGIGEYQRLFFGHVSWLCLQGVFVEDPYNVAPWPEGLKEREAEEILKKAGIA